VGCGANALSLDASMFEGAPTFPLAGSLSGERRVRGPPSVSPRPKREAGSRGLTGTDGD
jgi:hypothetical protein